MTAFLPIASRVEAAVTAYKSIQDFADKQEWETAFKRERVSAHLHGVSIATFEIGYCHLRATTLSQEWGFLPPLAPYFGRTFNSSRER
jgi:hypothetical protein